MSTKLYNFTVGTQTDRTFPLDMLRYDGCWPRGQVDVATLRVALTEASQPADRRITLTGVTPPTVERWATFGWRILEITT